MPKKRSFRRYVSNIIGFANAHIRNSLRDRSGEFYAGEVTPELEELMRKVWQPLIEPDKDVVVVRIKKPRDARSLGFSIEGIDEVRSPNKGTPGDRTTFEPRHFVQTVLPDGLIGGLDIIRPGDELLQVNGRRLRGTSYTHTVRSLRSLPTHIELVVARTRPGSHAPLYPEGDLLLTDEPPLEVMASEVNSVDTAYSSQLADRLDSRSAYTQSTALSSRASHTRVSEWIRRSVVELPESGADHNASRPVNRSQSLNTEVTYRYPSDLASSTPAAYHSLSRPVKFPSVDRLSPSRDAVDRSASSTLRRPARLQLHDPRYGWRRPVWSAVPLLIQLVKSSNGFGFSLSEYEELAVTDTDAKQRGRSLTLGRRRLPPRPGSTLGSGPTKLHRSASLPRSWTRTTQAEKSSQSSSGHRRQCFLLVDSIVPGGLAAQDGRIAVGDRLLFVNDRNLAKASLREATAALRAAPNGPCLLGVAKMHFKRNISEVPDAVSPMDGLLGDANFGGGGGSGYEPLYVNTVTPVIDNQPASFAGEIKEDHPLDFHRLPAAVNETRDTLLHSPYLVVTPVARQAEKVVRIPLLSRPIGIKLDALAVGGQDGCRVVEVLPGGAVSISGALKPNDYVTQLDGRAMRHVTNVEAFEQLCHCSNTKEEIEVVYLPAEVVLSHRSAQVQLSKPQPPIGFVIDQHRPESGRQWTAEKVVLQRAPHENAWGMELIGKDRFTSTSSGPASQLDLDNPTFVHSITPDTAAERCGLLQPGDLILMVNGVDVSKAGQDATRKLLRDPLLAGHLRLELGVRYATCPYPTSGGDEVNRMVVSAAVEPRRRRESGDSRNQPKRPGSVISPESSHTDAPEPLSELELRDELNVLSRPTPERANTDSGEDYPTMASITGPVLADESLTTGEEDPIPSPPPRSCSNDVHVPPTEALLSLPLAVGDPVSLYKRAAYPDDQILQFHVLLDQDNTTADSKHLGMRLVGSRAPDFRATYVFGFRSNASAAQASGIFIGDEIVQVDQFNVVGAGHLIVRQCLATQVVGKQNTVTSTTVPNGPVNHAPPAVLIVVRRNPSNVAVMASPSPPPEHSSSPRHSVTFASNHLQPPYPLGVAEEKRLKTESQPLSSPVCNGWAPNDSAVASLPFMDQIALILNEPVDQFDIFNLEIKRSADGYGIFIVNYGPEDKPGVFVSDLAPNGSAAKQGKLRPHDRILAVNGMPQNSYDATLRLMKESTSSVRLTVARRKPGVVATAPQPSPVPSPRPPIVPGQETLIELTRHPDSTLLGLSVVGGKGTVLEDIIIHSIREDGLAALDGRLAVGDRLLAVNGISLRGTDHQTATEALRSSTSPLQLLVYRDPLSRWLSQDEPEQVEVVLKRIADQNLGLTLVGRSPYSTGTAIAAITEGTAAAESGLLEPGDVLIELNGLDVRLANVHEVLALFKQPVDEFRLKVERPAASNPPSCPPAQHPSHRLDLYVVVLTRSAEHNPPVDQAPIGFGEPLLGLSNAQASFGLFLRQANAAEIAEAGGQLIVEDVLPASPAAMSIMIKPGDRLLTVDREPVDWLSPDEVFGVLSARTECTLEFGRLPAPPYLVDPGLSAACYPAQPADPSDTQQFNLPGLLIDGDMPTIESPIGFREMNALIEEEAPQPAEQPTEDAIQTDAAPAADQSDDASSVDSVVVRDALHVAEQASHGFQIRQIELPPPSGSDLHLGIRLRRSSGVSGTIVLSVQPNSPAAEADLRVGDRILGVDNKLLVSLGPEMRSARLVALIEELWRSTSTEHLGLTVISPTLAHNQYNGIEAPAVKQQNDVDGLDVTEKPTPQTPESCPTTADITSPTPPPSDPELPNLKGDVIYGTEGDDTGTSPSSS